jgi:hypothetical protein
MGLVRNAVRGAIAGAIATTAMDLVWFRRYRADGGTGTFRTWEFTTTAQSFDDGAPAPAQVGKRIADTVGITLDDAAVTPTNNVVHWMTGIGWGEFAGVTAAVLPVPALAVGIATGVTAWGASYALLGAAGIYKPITAYDAKTLWKDLSAHLVFGTTIGLALTAANRASRR